MTRTRCASSSLIPARPGCCDGPAFEEPFGALDPSVRDRLQQSLLRLRKQLGLTAIFVTHDMAEALLLGDRVAVMDKGRLLQIGTGRALYEAPASEEVAALLSTPLVQARRVEAALGLRAQEEP